jgi:hypothetical protein
MNKWDAVSVAPVPAGPPGDVSCQIVEAGTPLGGPAITIAAANGELLDRLMAALNGAGWISVEERLPELGVEVLTYGAGSPSADAYGVNQLGLSRGEWVFEVYSPVTHWMPLPGPPKP